jgi:hypothetical protein
MTDTAKELLAHADYLDALESELVTKDFDMQLEQRGSSPSIVADCLRRLSARQQASVELLRQWLNEQPYKSSTLAERLLAKYDIFEKVEG